MTEPTPEVLVGTIDHAVTPPHLLGAIAMLTVAQALDTANLNPWGISWTASSRDNGEVTVHMLNALSVRRAAEYLMPGSKPEPGHHTLLTYKGTFAGMRLYIYGSAA